MGNAATKEARPSGLRHGQSRTYHDTDSSHSRGAQERSFLGLSGNDRGTSSSEPRRETRQEREARKREKERAARIKERERSMKTEHVDGGYLVTQGVYVGTEDFNKPIVRQLMIERRIAPFWRGLQDFSTSWAEHQIMAAARGLPIPPADEVPPELEYKAPPPASQEDRQNDKFLNTLTVPIASRSQSFNSDSSAGARKTPPQPQSPAGTNPSGSQLFRGRAKTLASLTTSSKSNSNMAPREIQLPHDPFVNGQPIEVYLYKDPMECPICFLYYPPYLNKTRCCDQPICSECFVQIKRADPHPPEHEQPGANPSRDAESQTNESEHQLVTEPAACPFCVQPEFGVTYAQPPFRRGLAYAPGHGGHHLGAVASPMSSSSSLNSANASPGTTTTRRRATSLSADAPGVITTDKIRPDWAQKLATARANAARRSAAATALHTAAYLMNNNNNNNSTSSSNGESRNLANIGRRALLRRGTGNDSPTSRSNSTHVNAFAYLAERRATERIDGEEQSNNNSARGTSRRERSRAEEIEEMMIMEAIRLSLTTEEERRKKEEKEAKKEAKKREKEAKRAGKSAAQNEESSSTNESSSSTTGPTSTDAGLPENVSLQDKGKGIARPAPAPVTAPAEQGEVSSSSQATEQPPKLTLNTPLAGESSAHAGASPSPRPHPRSHSSASSSDISLVESAFDDQKDTGTPNGSNPNIDAVFNFRSLAAMVGDAENERTETSSQPVPIPASGQASDSGNCDPQRESSKAQDPPYEGKEAQSQSTEISSQSPIS